MVNYWELVATPSTKLLLHLNGNSTDASGNGNHWRNSNISYVNGYFGQGASFGGATSKIELSPASIWIFWTISCWFKRWTPSWQDIIITRWWTTNDRRLFGFIWGSTTLQVMCWSDATLRNISTTDTNRHNVVFTYTPTSYNAYFDWTIKLNAISSTYTDQENVTCIGNFIDGTWAYKWLIDEVIIENRAWSATEVLNYYNQSKGVYAPKMI